MAAQNSTVKRQQNLFLEDGSRLNMSGVSELLGFDEQAISLQTDLGRLEIRGSDMHVEAFETATGDMLVTGNITALVYTGEVSRGSFFKRLFR